MKDTKLCPNGHVLDARWDRCPYCPAAPRAPVPPTRVGAAPGLLAPVPPPLGPAPAPAAVPRAARRTVIREVEERVEKAIPLVGWLVVLTGSQRGEDFRLREGKNAVGSDPQNDVVLADPHVSGRHASINTVEREGERSFVLRDLDSANGTYLNDDVEPRFYEELIDNDRIRFGTVMCKFKCV